MSTTINRELGAWIRILRKQWMEPSPNQKPVWSFWKRFGVAFVGSSVFSVGVLGRQLSELGIPVFIGEMYLPLVIPVFIIIISYSFWFAWLVSWRDFGYGPVRLFLSAMLLAALVSKVLEFSYS